MRKFCKWRPRNIIINLHTGDCEQILFSLTRMNKACVLNCQYDERREFSVQNLNLGCYLFSVFWLCLVCDVWNVWPDQIVLCNIQVWQCDSVTVSCHGVIVTRHRAGVVTQYFQPFLHGVLIISRAASHCICVKFLPVRAAASQSSDGDCDWTVPRWWLCC